MNSPERIKLYNKLFSEKKFSQIIEEIEKFEKFKTSQILNILGVCKMLQNNRSKEDLISANENFRQAYLKEKNSLVLSIIKIRLMQLFILEHGCLNLVN